MRTSSDRGDELLRLLTRRVVCSIKSAQSTVRRTRSPQSSSSASHGASAAPGSHLGCVVGPFPLRCPATGWQSSRQDHPHCRCALLPNHFTPDAKRIGLSFSETTMRPDANHTRLGFGRTSVAAHDCPTALHGCRPTDMFGASFSEATARPSPNCTRPRRRRGGGGARRPGGRTSACSAKTMVCIMVYIALC